jgi:hypothetical protein
MSGGPYRTAAPTPEPALEPERVSTPSVEECLLQLSVACALAGGKLESVSVSPIAMAALLKSVGARALYEHQSGGKSLLMHGPSGYIRVYAGPAFPSGNIST